MENEKKSRAFFFLTVFGVIVLIHVIVLYSCMHKNSSGPEPEKKDTVAENATDAEKTTPDVKIEKLRVPSGNPRFGEPLEFSHALHGTALDRIIPGASGAKSAILVDMNTRRVIWEKNCRKAVPIASMTKMMTLLLTVEALDRDPSRSLDDVIDIPKSVMTVPRTGNLWLEPGEKFTMRELLTGATVKSANDAAFVCAEVTGGSGEKFIDMMNQRAKELHLTAHFTTMHGLPDKSGAMPTASALDMVLLGERLLEYPVLMEMFSTQQSSIRDGKTTFTNTNRLINPRYPGVEGLKTGYTKQAGFCLTFSVMRDRRRLMGCVTGFASAQERDRFCRKLIDWAYKQKTTR